MPFRDVPQGAWYARDVEEAAAAEFVKGAGGGMFRPTASVTRAEAAAMLMRLWRRVAPALGMPGYRSRDVFMWLRSSSVRISAPKLGTAFCIAPNRLLTAWHVVSSGAATADHLDNLTDHRPASWAGHSDRLYDWALLENPFRGLVPLPLAAQPPRNGDMLFGIGCGSGEPGTALRFTCGLEVAGSYPDSGIPALRRLLVCHGGVQEGDSGGLLANEHGQLVSMILAKKPGDTRAYGVPFDVFSQVYSAAQGA